MKIIARYTEDNNGIKPIAPSAKNKLDYVIRSLLTIGENVELLSLCTVSLDRKKIRKHTQKVSDGFEIRYLTCFWKRSLFEKVIHRIVDPIRVFFQLMTRVKKGDLILSYHNMSFQKILFFVKKIKKCKLILEVEEIYGMVYQDRSTVNKEMRRFRKADAFIFPTRLLGERINTKNKPAVIAHGSYDVPKIVDRQRKDRLIHCVYAGTFNPKKGGAEIAVGAARFLSDKYHVHIIGFGSPEETKTVLDQIESVQKEAACRITYDGLKTGKDYFDFLQNCDVGLSTQNPDAPFNATSFPSKILSYMAAGLRVVTARIPVVETSAIGEHLYYYERSDSEMIAQAIESIDYSEKYDSRLLIRKLDEIFETDLSKMIRTVTNKENNK